MTPVTAPPDLVEFCRAQFPRLVAFLRLHAGDHEAAQDLAQETLARVCERWDRVRAMKHPDRWALRVAINLSTSRHRRRTSERRANGLYAVSTTTTDPVDTSPNRDALRLALDRLGERQRAVVIMRFLLDLSVADVADILNTSEGAVRSATNRALDTLRSDTASGFVVERATHA